MGWRSQPLKIVRSTESTCFDVSVLLGFKASKYPDLPFNVTLSLCFLTYFNKNNLLAKLKYRRTVSSTGDTLAKPPLFSCNSSHGQHLLEMGSDTSGQHVAEIRKLGLYYTRRVLYRRYI